MKIFADHPYFTNGIGEYAFHNFTTNIFISIIDLDSDIDKTTFQ